MRWKQPWPDRPPRPKVQPTSSEERRQILGVFQDGIEASPVLSALGINVSARRGRFYFERTSLTPEAQAQVIVISRATPLLASSGNLLLEAEGRSSSWHEVAQGSAQTIIDTLAGDTKGTFHGLGALDASLRKLGKGPSRRPLRQLESSDFTFVETGEVCTFHEVMFHFFGLPIDIIAEPRQWYIYQRQPRLLEVNEDQAQILVAFTADGVLGSFASFCLYAIRDGKWHAFPLKPNQSRDIDTAVAWLEKRKWRAWS